MYMKNINNIFSDFGKNTTSNLLINIINKHVFHINSKCSEVLLNFVNILSFSHDQFILDSSILIS